MNSKFKSVTAAAIALLFVAACGTSGNSGLGGIFGGGSNSGTANTEIRGTVDSVDLNSNSIYLVNVSNYNRSMLSNSGSGNAVRVYFDNRTPVDYQGRSYQAADLERGDQISVRIDQSGNRLYANSVSVLSDVRNRYPNGSNPNGSRYPNGSTYPNNGTSGSTLHGTVRSIDTNRRTISVDAGYGSYSTIQYDSNTPVYFNGGNYTPSDLEVGDEIDVRASSIGSNRYQAQDITVTRSISGTGSTNNGTSGTYGQTNGSTIRGTVLSVDTNRRTITLQGVNFTGFDRNTQNGGTITVQYDTNTSVDVQGQAYPVTGLQRGDVVDVQVGSGTYNSNSNYFAQRIFLVRDVNQR
ncbi:MAG TPA: DUF5666 domain-containing protein [Thermoanaerobaculia bacterium]